MTHVNVLPGDAIVLKGRSTLLRVIETRAEELTVWNPHKNVRETVARKDVKRVLRAEPEAKA